MASQIISPAGQLLAVAAFGWVSGLRWPKRRVGGKHRRPADPARRRRHRPPALIESGSDSLDSLIAKWAHATPEYRHRETPARLPATWTAFALEPEWLPRVAGFARDWMPRAFSPRLDDTVTDLIPALRAAS